MDNKINKIQKDGVEYNIEDPGAARSADLASKQDALNSTQLTAVNSGIDSTKVAQIETNRQGVATNSGEIAIINGKIPAQASASNQLADKGFVNSSIQTQTAHFRGNWESWTNVPTDASEYPADDDGNHEPTTNDYMVVQDASGFPVGSGEPALAGTWRFKYSGTWTTNGKNGWLPEYQVNETPLTAAQLAALNSGITDTAVAKLNGIEAGAEVNDIDSISVNGTPVTPDENKNVNLTIDGGIKTLTTADYDYPDNNPTKVALWRLDNGLYNIPHGITAAINTTTDVEDEYDTRDSALALIARRNVCNITIFAADQYGYVNYNYLTSPNDGTDSTNYPVARRTADQTLLTGRMVADNLTSTSTTAPLSANQGRVLNNKIVGTTETTTIATTDWAALSSSDPYDYSATVTATASINASTGVVELLNDQPVLFGTYGFAIGAVSGQSVTIYSIGQPDASVSLKLNIRNL